MRLGSVPRAPRRFEATGVLQLAPDRCDYLRESQLARDQPAASAGAAVAVWIMHNARELKHHESPYGMTCITAK